MNTGYQYFMALRKFYKWTTKSRAVSNLPINCQFTNRLIQLKQQLKRMNEIRFLFEMKVKLQKIQSTNLPCQYCKQSILALFQLNFLANARKWEQFRLAENCNICVDMYYCPNVEVNCKSKKRWKSAVAYSQAVKIGIYIKIYLRNAQQF